MLIQLSCIDFTSELAAKKPIPGGGGAAGYVAAIGTALNTMVANYSIGKKKFIDIQDKHNELICKGEILREKLVNLVDKDAELFEPLSMAYSMPSKTDDEKKQKDKLMQECLKDACSAPLDILFYSYEAILLHKEIVDISTNNIISDVGVGVQCLKAALNSAYLNVLINFNSINDEDYVILHKENVERLVAEGTRIADEVYNKVLKILSK